MRIVRAQISNFRNIETVLLEPDGHLNGFWGENGQGKTSMLEALYSSLRGSSFRPHTKMADLLPDSGLAPRLELLLEDDRGYQNTISYSYDAQAVKPRWVLNLNGKKTRFLSFKQRFPVVVFSPDDHQLVRGAPEVRRNFLDQVFSEVCPGYEELLKRFEKVLKSRNSLLKRVKELEQQQSAYELLEELDTWDKLFSNEAAELMILRRQLWPDFQSRYLECAADLSKELGGRVQVDFLESIEAPLELEAQELSSEILKGLNNNLVVDRALGWTRKGPHRDDFQILLDGKNTRVQASQGQARILALALRWVHALWVKMSVTESPVFLIDDLSSELDAKRRHQLFEEIFNLSGQVFVTGTDPSIVDVKSVSQQRHYRVKNGSLDFFGVVNGGERRTDRSV